MKSLILKFLTSRLPASAFFAFIVTTMVGINTRAEPILLTLVAVTIILNMTLGWLYGAGDGAEFVVERLKKYK